jgi:hypothetical protein
MANIRGNNQWLGTYGKVWWDGEEVFEIESFEAKVKVERDGVSFAGSLDSDSKIKGLKGEGKLKIKKVFSRGKRKFLEAYKRGEDIRSQLIGLVKDPDAIGKQSERIVLNNVWFNDLTLMDFELEKKMDEEISFGFTVSDVDFPDEAKVM